MMLAMGMMTVMTRTAASDSDNSHRKLNTRQAWAQVACKCQLQPHGNLIG